MFVMVRIVSLYSAGCSGGVECSNSHLTSSSVYEFNDVIQAFLSIQFGHWTITDKIGLQNRTTMQAKI